jgi:hypothetical protein
VPDNKEIVAVLFLQYIFKTGNDPIAKVFYTFPFPGWLKVNQFSLSFLQFIRKARPNLFEREALPIPEIHLSEFMQMINWNIMVTGNNLSALDRSLKIARIDGADRGKTQPLGKPF